MQHATGPLPQQLYIAAGEVEHGVFDRVWQFSKSKEELSNEVLCWYQYHFKSTDIGTGIVIF